MGLWIKKIIDALNLIKPPFNVNEVAQKAAVESLKDKNLYYVQLNIIYIMQKIKRFFR